MKPEKQGKREQSEPTKSESWRYLRVLWQSMAPTRFVLSMISLNEQKLEVNYASTLKLMQIMAEKGLLQWDESQVKHVYSPASEE